MRSLIPEITSTSKLSIKKAVWTRLILELRTRGCNVRESGAFLLGFPGSTEITDFVCYDDLDPSCYDTGIIVFHTSGYVPLWEYCEAQSLTVIADVHTHPLGWTGQSRDDKAHPMIVQAGHISLIVPRYAQANTKSMRGVGFHEYLGDLQWKTCSKISSKFRFL